MGKFLQLAFIAGVFWNLQISSVNAQHNTTVFLSKINNPSLRITIENNATQILTEFNYAFAALKFPEIKSESISRDAKNVIKSLWATQSFMCPETKIITNLVKRPGGGYEIRNIPLSVKSSGKQINEEGVLIFTPSGRLENIYFGLDYQRYGRLLRAGRTVKEFQRRQIILDFIENYRTAYNRKDLLYINKVFSENALIIVGKVIEIKHKTDDFLANNLGTKKVELIRLSKSEYVKNLKKVFAANEFIKVGFKEIEIYQHPKYERIYGVTLQQDWASSNYSDQGYLFLMIDFKDEQNPMIHVRTWQPEAYTTEDDVIGLGDFEIIQ